MLHNVTGKGRQSGVQFLMGTNLLTGHTDRHWKAVRKGVAPAFSAQHMRCAFCLDASLLQIPPLEAASQYP